jgi:hypothetical protein
MFKNHLNANKGKKAVIYNSKHSSPQLLFEVIRIIIFLYGFNNQIY